MSNTYQELGTRIGGLVDQKRASYGASLEASGAFLRLLYPAGIPSDQTVYALIFARTFEKQTRFVTSPDAFGESPFVDMVGHCLLGAQHYEERKQGCGIASDAEPSQSKGTHASAASDTSAKTTTSANEASAPTTSPTSNDSPESSSAPASTTAESAPALTAQEAASEDADDPRRAEERWRSRLKIEHSVTAWITRNRHDLCAACDFPLKRCEAHPITLPAALLLVCSQDCYSFLKLNGGLA